MAPFQGITGATYREIYTRFFTGIDKMYTPFFTAIHKDKSIGRKAFELSFINQNGIPVVPQILSKDSSEIIRFGNYCHERGFQEINWNLGCPYPRVANKKRGSGMLPYPGMVEEILEQVMPVLKINFSIKCRLGYYQPEEILQLIPVFNHYNIMELTVHARIGKQLYKGEVDHKAFDQARKLINVPLVYNGDIFTGEDHKQFSQQFQTIDKWMIGRGLLIDPFLPGEIKGLYQPDINERKKIIHQFISDLYIAYRKNKKDSLHIIGIMKELWGSLSLSFDEPVRVFNTLKKAKTFGEYEDAIDKIFEEFEWIGAGKRR